MGERVSAVAGAAFLTTSLALFLPYAPSEFGRVGGWAIALALSGLGMGVALPSSSSVMANEVKVSEFGVMSAAQLLAMQVGEVAGIQVLETVQQSIARRRGLSHAHSGPALLATFHSSFVIGALVAAGASSRVDEIMRLRCRVLRIKAGARAAGSLEPYE